MAKWFPRPVVRLGLAHAASLAALSQLAACTPHRPVEGPVRLGQLASVNGPRVRADKVIEDSRCPIGTQCVWAGRLLVRATVIGGGWIKQFDLTLGLPVNVADGRLTLVDASLPKRSNRRDGAPVRYLFTFDFQGGL